LLIPFSSHHLNTNFGNTKFFIVSWTLSLISWPVLIRKAVLIRWKYESSGFPRGPTRLLPRLMPLPQLRTVPEAAYMIMHHRTPWPPFFVLLVYMIRHHRILWQCRLHDHASSYPVASNQPTPDCSPSRFCTFPFHRLDSNHGGPIPSLLRLRSRRRRRVCILHRTYAQQPPSSPSQRSKSLRGLVH
jgi:hypothetical protein